MTRTLAAVLACGMFALLAPGCGRSRGSQGQAAAASASASSTPALAASESSSADAPLPAAPGELDVPAGYLAARVFRVVETSQGDVVLLGEEGAERYLPIFVGGTEALSIKMRHDKHRYPRPLTHDLLDTLLDKLGGRVVKVHVDDLKNRVFIGRVYVAQGGRTFDVDARPSDAIALAVGSRVPIFVAKSVFDAAALPARELGLGEEPDGVRVPPRSKPDEPTQL